MRLYVNGSEAMRIDSSGNVGIGETSPSRKFHVNSGTANAVSVFESTDATAYIQLKDTAGSGAVGTTGSGNGLRFWLGDGATEAMRIDSSGNVILNQSAGAADNTILRITGGTAGFSTLHLADTADINIGFVQYDHTNNALTFASNNAERMRIDSSGNLLVGTTTNTNSGQGINIRANGIIKAGATSSDVLNLFRLSTDGDIVKFYKDGTTVGNIGTQSGRLVIGSGDTGLRMAADLNNIVPWNTTTNLLSDSAIDLGGVTQRFKDFYLSGGVYLGGTGAANHLDDYEEGTFTVTATFGTSGSATLDRDLLSYTKIGQVVYITGQIEFDVLSSPTGALTINIPFTAKSPVGSDRETNSFFVGKFQSLNAAPPTGSDGDDFWVNPDGSTITLQFYNGYTNTATDIDSTYLKSGTRLTITGWYLAA